MKALRWTALGLAGLVALLFLLAWLGPLLFRPQIRQWVRAQVNDRLEAEVDFSDLHLSLFRDFPKLAVVVEELSVVGQAPFEGVELLRTEALTVSVDLVSALRRSQPVEVVSFALRQPRVQAIVREDGRANYDIFPDGEAPADTAGAPGEASIVINLRDYRLEQGRFLYADSSAGTFLEGIGLEHAGSGNLADAVFSLKARTRIDSLTVRQGDITYVDRAAVRWETDLAIDQTAGSYTLADDRLEINRFPLALSGTVREEGDGWFIDLDFSSPQGSFQEFLSLLPGQYTASVAEAEVSGQFSFSGMVEGLYRGEPETYPTFALLAEVSEGRVQYPGLPQALEQIAFSARIESPTADLDDMTIDVEPLSLRLGGERISGQFQLRDPVSDLAVEARLQGTLDLATWRQAVPADHLDDLSGRVSADIELGARRSQIEAEAWDQITASGQLRLEDILYAERQQPDVRISSATLQLQPGRLLLSDVDARLGRSDVRGSARLNDYLAYFADPSSISGNVQIRSQTLDLAEWYGDSVLYDPMVFTGVVLEGALSADRVDLSRLAAQWAGSDVEARGELSGLADYWSGDGVLRGRIDLSSRRLDLNALMENGEAEESTPAGGAPPAAPDTLAPILLPERLNLDLRFAAERLLYGHFDLRQANGRLQIQDQRLAIEQARASTLGGDLGLTGSYDTRNPADPRFDLQLRLNRLAFAPAFQSINTFALLAPIGRFVDGHFNAELDLDGSLGPDMMPDFRTLDARGYLETLEAVIRQVAPLQAIGEQLKIAELSQDWSLDDVRSQFVVQDGQLRVEPFDLVVKDIPMTISGYHGLVDQRLDYAIQATVPREMLARSQIGALADEGLSFLERQAQRLGLGVKPGSDIPVGIQLGGRLDQPEVRVKIDPQ